MKASDMNGHSDDVAIQRVPTIVRGISKNRAVQKNDAKDRKTRLRADVKKE